MSTNLGDHSTLMSICAVLVERQGGTATISQAELDGVAYGRLLEGTDEDGNCLIKFEGVPNKLTN